MKMVPMQGKDGMYCVQDNNGKTVKCGMTQDEAKNMMQQMKTSSVLAGIPSRFGYKK